MEVSSLLLLYSLVHITSFLSDEGGESRGFGSRGFGGGSNGFGRDRDGGMSYITHIPCIILIYTSKPYYI